MSYTCILQISNIDIYIRISKTFKVRVRSICMYRIFQEIETITIYEQTPDNYLSTSGSLSSPWL